MSDPSFSRILRRIRYDIDPLKSAWGFKYVSCIPLRSYNTVVYTFQYGSSFISSMVGKIHEVLWKRKERKQQAISVVSFCDGSIAF